MIFKRSYVAAELGRIYIWWSPTDRSPDGNVKHALVALAPKDEGTGSEGAIGEALPFSFEHSGDRMAPLIQMQGLAESDEGPHPHQGPYPKFMGIRQEDILPRHDSNGGVV